MGRGPVQGAEDVFTDHGQVVNGTGLDIGYPQRESVWLGERLHVAAVLVGLPRVPQVDLIPFLTSVSIAMT
jgi:hypothetical protein